MAQPSQNKEQTSPLTSDEQTFVDSVLRMTPEEIKNIPLQTFRNFENGNNVILNLTKTLREQGDSSPAAYDRETAFLDKLDQLESTDTQKNTAGNNAALGGAGMAGSFKGVLPKVFAAAAVTDVAGDIYKAAEQNDNKAALQRTTGGIAGVVWGIGGAAATTILCVAAFGTPVGWVALAAVGTASLVGGWATGKYVGANAGHWLGGKLYDQNPERYEKLGIWAKNSTIMKKASEASDFVTDKLASAGRATRNAIGWLFGKSSAAEETANAETNVRNSADPASGRTQLVASKDDPYQRGAHAAHFNETVPTGTGPVATETPAPVVTQDADIILKQQPAPMSTTR